MAYNLSRAICGKSLALLVANQAISQASLNGTRAVTMKVVPHKPLQQESFDDINAKLKRPQSPHLSIYSLQITSVLSISHRITGAALSGITFGFGVGALALPHDFTHYMNALEGLHLGGATLIALKFILAFPLTFHTVNGVRHLAWDSGKFLSLKEVYTTGYAMLAVSFITAAILATL